MSHYNSAVIVWVWMVCSLHSVTTGSRDRANVSLLVIIIIKDSKCPVTRIVAELYIE